MSTQEITTQRARRDPLKYAFQMQRNTAKSRGVEWELTFEEWMSIWTDSGKLEQRGRGIGKFVMSRRGDMGPYAVGNVFIQPSVANNAEAPNKRRVKKSDHPGVFNLYPGRKRSWQAKYSRVSLGLFETAKEAIDARKKYMDERGLDDSSHKFGSGKGWVYSNGRYTMRCYGMKQSQHATAEEAHAAYLVAVETRRKMKESAALH